MKTFPFIRAVLFCMVILFILSIHIDGVLQHVSEEEVPGLMPIVIAGILANNSVDFIRKGGGVWEAILYGGAGVSVASTALYLMF